MTVTVLLDAGYGDNGKGKIANDWARRGHFSAVVEGGVGPSAAHCVRDGDNDIWYSEVPSGWLSAGAELFIGPGVLLDPVALVRELRELERFEVVPRLRLDHRCGLLRAEHLVADRERHFEGGCVSARADQVLGTLQPASSELALSSFLEDVPAVLAKALSEGRRILVSGSHGHWYDPYRAPSRDRATAEPCGSSAALSRAGIAASRDVDVVGVVGAVTTTVLPSVPMTDELATAEVERRGLVSYGRVSKQRRRVALAPQWAVLQDFVELERPVGLVLARADLLDPSSRGATTAAELPSRVQRLMDEVVERTGVQVVGVSTGPSAGDYLELQKVVEIGEPHQRRDRSD